MYHRQAASSRWNQGRNGCNYQDKVAQKRRYEYANQEDNVNDTGRKIKSVSPMFTKAQLEPIFGNMILTKLQTVAPAVGATMIPQAKLISDLMLEAVAHCGVTICNNVQAGGNTDRVVLPEKSVGVNFIATIPKIAPFNKTLGGKGTVDGREDKAIPYGLSKPMPFLPRQQHKQGLIIGDSQIRELFYDRRLVFVSMYRGEHSDFFVEKLESVTISDKV